ncbi:MAG: glycosyl transferase [Bacteroidetes bacterium]|nr:MAG: glycosyl transferase [Bacteroidota bacterium]
MNSPAPIALFAYNRPDHLQRCIEALQKNELSPDSDLILFCDGPKNEEARKEAETVRQYAKSISGFKSIRIVERDENYGLSKNIIDGVTSTVNTYGSVIVIEDDLVCSPHFLDFMNQGLNKFQGCNDVISIHGYCPPISIDDPVFFLRGADCWGWATWKRGWQLFNPDGKELMKKLRDSGKLYDFDFEGSYDYSGMLQKQIEGKVNSWAIRWYASAYLQDKLTLYPSKSLVINIGSDGSGTHQQSESETRTDLYTEKIIIPDIPIQESPVARKDLAKYFYSHLGIKGRLRKLLKWGY